MASGPPRDLRPCPSRASEPPPDLRSCLSTAPRDRRGRDESVPRTWGSACSGPSRGGGARRDIRQRRTDRRLASLRDDPCPTATATRWWVRQTNTGGARRARKPAVGVAPPQRRCAQDRLGAGELAWKLASTQCSRFEAEPLGPSSRLPPLRPFRTVSETSRTFTPETPGRLPARNFQDVTRKLPGRLPGNPRTFTRQELPGRYPETSRPFTPPGTSRTFTRQELPGRLPGRNFQDVYPAGRLPGRELPTGGRPLGKLLRRWTA